jgi:hypothetical protein
MMTLKLPDVTLVMIETREHELANLAVRDCLAGAKFADVLIFTDQKSDLMTMKPSSGVPDWLTDWLEPLSLARGCAARRDYAALSIHGIAGLLLGRCGPASS